MSQRKAFNFYLSFFEVFEELPNDKEKLDFIKALLNKQFYGEEPNLTGMAKFAYISQQQVINQQVEGWENKTKTTLSKGVNKGGSQGGTVQGEEKGEEKGEGQQVKLTFEQRKEKFLIWFNEQKKVYTGRKGSTKQMTPTDDNNLKKLLKAYEHEDFKIALSNMYKSQWAKENNMRTVSHFIRIENFNKYLEQGDTDQSKIAIFPDPVN